MAQGDRAPPRVLHLHLGDHEPAVRVAARPPAGQLVEGHRFETQRRDAGELRLEADGVGVAGRPGAVRRRGDDREVVALDQRARPVGGGRLDGLERGERDRGASDQPLLPLGGRGRALEGLAEAGDLRVERLERDLLPGVREVVGLPPPHRLLLDVREEGLEGVEVAGQVGVELVVVALCAAHGGAHPDARDVPRAVGEVDRAVLLRLRAALLGRLQQPVVAGSDPLLERGVGQEVAGQLLGGEPVEGQVAVEGGDHPVAVAPHRPRVVAVVAHAVGVADQVEPEDGHPLAVAPARPGAGRPAAGTRPRARPPRRRGPPRAWGGGR